MKIEMRFVTPEEAKLCASFIKEAREYQNEQGFVQWTAQYPNLGTIQEDIKKETRGLRMN